MMKHLKLTDNGIQLLAQLSRDRGLYAECKGAELDALQELGILQWFDARSSTTPFKEDLRAFLRLLGLSGRIDYAWVAAVENWRELVGPEVSAKVDAVDQVEWAVNSARFAGSPRSVKSTGAAAGPPTDRDTVVEPAARRARPILLTASAVILGMIPIASTIF
jgi:hypothetical protein